MPQPYIGRSIATLASVRGRRQIALSSECVSLLYNTAREAAGKDAVDVGRLGSDS